MIIPSSPAIPMTPLDSTTGVQRHLYEIRERVGSFDTLISETEDMLGISQAKKPPMREDDPSGDPIPVMIEDIYNTLVEMLARLQYINEALH